MNTATATNASFEQPCENVENMASIRDYFTLLKPGVMLLVVFTGAVGMWMAPGGLHPLLQVITIISIALGSGAGGALNMWYDRDIDGRMKRTSTRPIPSGKIPASDVLVLGLILSIASVSMLGLAVGWASAGLLAFAIWFYSVVYTMILKRRTPQNIVIGGAAGAFPPIIGWLAVTTELTYEPFIYFAIVFFWTPPHFWALALYRSSDYKAVNIPMMPVAVGVEATKRYILAYTILLVLITLLPTITGTSGLVYLAFAVILGGGFLYHALSVFRSECQKNAMKMFGFSIIYLFILFIALPLDRLINIGL